MHTVLLYFFSTGNLERGWNDPPVFLYNGSVPQTSNAALTTKRQPLTKRVAFPLTSPSTAIGNAGEAATDKPPLGITQFAGSSGRLSYHIAILDKPKDLQ